MAKYITTIDAAAILCTHPGMLRQARMSGFLFARPAPTFYKMGTRKIVYRLDDLEAFVESGRVIPESQSAAAACDGAKEEQITTREVNCDG
jgi:hypothetical protein